MDKINPPVQQNYLIRPNQDFEKNSALCEVVSEMGIFGIILWCVTLLRYILHIDQYLQCIYSIEKGDISDKLV